jgi:hypothetical protein
MSGILIRLALVLATLAVFWLSIQSLQAQTQGSSLRFYGTGRNDIDRVKFALTNPPRPIDVQFDFTIELWLKLDGNTNQSGTCKTGGDSWINGNALVDRDIFDQGDFGDYGISIYGQRVAFGVNNGSTGNTICGSQALNDGQWHHIAVTREEQTGQLRIFVDGKLDAQGSGPRGNISYNDARVADYVNEPHLVLGAEKHDYDRQNYPSFHGWVDELRISDIVRYSGEFARPSQPWSPDEATMGLFHFDEGSGTTVADSSWYQQSQFGTLFVGGPSNGPQWSSDTPFRLSTTPTVITVSPSKTQVGPTQQTPELTITPVSTQSVPTQQTPKITITPSNTQSVPTQQIPELTVTPSTTQTFPTQHAPEITITPSSTQTVPAITTTPSPTPLNPTELWATVTALPERNFIPRVEK